MIWTKGGYQRAKFQTSNCSCEISPNLYFDRLLLLKVYTISTKKVQKSYVLWHWRVMQNLKKNWFVVSKTTRNWWILTWALKSLKNLHFNGLLLTKEYNVWAKKVRGAIFHDIEEWCKVWRKTDLWFGKWQEELANFTTAFESLKIGTLTGCFYPK